MSHNSGRLEAASMRYKGFVTMLQTICKGITKRL
jgi:hypothetical protein